MVLLTAINGSEQVHGIFQAHENHAWSSAQCCSIVVQSCYWSVGILHHPSLYHSRDPSLADCGPRYMGRGFVFFQDYSSTVRVRSWKMHPESGPRSILGGQWHSKRYHWWGHQIRHQAGCFFKKNLNILSGLQPLAL